MVDYIALASGHIYSNKTNRVLRPACNGSGYQHVVLRVGGKNVDTYVHRFVAESLLPNPLNLPEVNHKDGDKSNNCLENLEWVTSAQNKAHARDTGLTPMKRVLQLTLDGEPFAVYKSATHAQIATGVPAGQIRSVCNGCKNTAHGYYWKYKE